MAREARYVLFTLEEVQAAVTDLVSRRGLPRDMLGLERVELLSADGKVAARGHYNRQFAREPLVVDHNELFASIVVHCRRQRIPLSNRSAKWLEIKDGGLALVMTMESGQTQAAATGVSWNNMDASGSRLAAQRRAAPTS